jgi:hypothetical protein
MAEEVNPYPEGSASWKQWNRYHPKKVEAPPPPPEPEVEKHWYDGFFDRDKTIDDEVERAVVGERQKRQTTDESQ